MAKNKEHYFMNLIHNAKKILKETEETEKSKLEEYQFTIVNLLTTLDNKKAAYLEYLTTEWSLESYNNINLKMASFNQEIKSSIKNITDFYNQNNFVGEKLKCIVNNNGTFNSIKNFDETMELLQCKIGNSDIEKIYKDKLDKYFFNFENVNNSNWEEKRINWYANQIKISIKETMQNHQYYCKNSLTQNKVLNHYDGYDSWINDNSGKKAHAKEIKDENEKQKINDLSLVP